MKIIISQNDKIPVAENGVGLFLEDINYALDGGLYAEMLENRNFEAKNASGSRGEFRAADDGAYGEEMCGDCRGLENRSGNPQRHTGVC